MYITVYNMEEIENIKDFNEDELETILKVCSYSHIDGKKYIVRNNALEENIKKYQPDELTDDYVPKTEVQIKEIEEKDKEQLKNYETEKAFVIEMKQRVKCLALDKMGKHILTNSNDLSQRELKKLQSLMHEYNDVEHEQIIKDFNELADEKLFENKLDMTIYPIFENPNIKNIVC